MSSLDKYCMNAHCPPDYKLNCELRSYRRIYNPPIWPDRVGEHCEYFEPLKHSMRQSYKESD